MEGALFMALIGIVVLGLLAFISPKNMCAYGGCYKPAGYEYEKELYCCGHYVVRKHDPYFFYAFL